MAEQKILECTLCMERYSVQDVKEGRYYPSTGVCDKCYVKASKGNKKVWCFGEFDKLASECRTECQDRRICKAFSTSKIALDS